jgi:hypothetical protein
MRGRPGPGHAGRVDAQMLHIAIDVRVDGDQITGHAGDGAGEPRPFSGWLGLIGALDRLLVDRHSTGARLGPPGGTAPSAGTGSTNHE